MYKIVLLGMWLLFVCSCGFSPPSLVPPYSQGISVDISKLEKEITSYDLYFCSPVYNPSAILFLKKDLDVQILLHKDWKQIKDMKDFWDLKDRIEYLNPYLYALVVRDMGSVYVVGYVYTDGDTYLKKIGDKKFFLLPISERFNDIYYGGDEFYRKRNY